MEAAAPSLVLRWLGGREVLRDGLPVHLESAKTEALLAWLVLNPGTHARGKLTALLWPELPEDVDGTRHARYWSEAFNGVVMRMALISLVLGAME